MSNITLVENTRAEDTRASPALAGQADLSDADRMALRRAVEALEKPGLAARLSAVAGAPLDMIGRALPAPVTDAVAQATESAMRASLKLALATLPAAQAIPPVPAGDLDRPLLDGTVEPESATLRTAARLAKYFPSSAFGHKAMAAVSGAVGGAFGLATLAVELPLSTTLMLRSIAQIAQEEGEDLADPENALACVQVFALGGREAAGSALTESGYFAVRAALAKTMVEAARYAGNRALLDEAAPALIRFSAQVAARFGIVVSQKVAAQAVPILGAVGGAAVNAAFMNHFQSTARAHFTVRRLERHYGAAAVRAAYESEKAMLGV